MINQYLDIQVFKTPQWIYFKRGCTGFALQEIANKKKVFVITDRSLFHAGMVKNITDILVKMQLDYQLFFNLCEKNTFVSVKEALKIIKIYKPDVILAFGGGFVIDVAKIAWLAYEQSCSLTGIFKCLMHQGKPICSFSPLGKKAELVAIPTTSGCGDEVSSFVTIIDEKKKEKALVFEYELMPTMAIVDANYVDDCPMKLKANRGVEVLINSIESLTTPFSSEYTKPHAKEAIKLILNNLYQACYEGAQNPNACEMVHYAATLSGLALSNTGFGLCTLMAKIFSQNFDISFTEAKPLFVCSIIMNSELDYLIFEIDELCKKLRIPISIKKYGIKKREFNNKLEEMVQNVFEEQKFFFEKIYSVSEIEQFFLSAYDRTV